MTQKARILRALRNGPVNSADFLNPVCDGGKPITRVAGRIFDLKEEGYRFAPEQRMMNGTATYTLASKPAEATTVEHTNASRSSEGISAPSSPPAAPSLLTGEQLFDLAVPEKKPRSGLEPWDKEAA